MEVVGRVRRMLEKDGPLDLDHMEALRARLQMRKKETNILRFSKHRELRETIAALDYLLETESKKQPAPDS
ncbi:MAG: hypothetical protein AAF348_11000 [Bacteroidota bacterium]